MNADLNAPCDCGSGLEYKACCEPFISGAKKAPTAEAIDAIAVRRLRSREHSVHQVDARS